MSEEEIKLINETMQLDYSQLVMSCVHLCMEKKKLKSQLQQKENIIKEIREYIEKEYVQVKNKEYNLSWNNLEYIIKEILEILDKAGSDKE